MRVFIPVLKTTMCTSVYMALWVHTLLVESIVRGCRLGDLNIYGRGLGDMGWKILGGNLGVI